MAKKKKIIKQKNKDKTITQQIKLSEHINRIKTHLKDNVLFYNQTTTSKDIASALNKSVSEIITFFFEKGIVINQNVPLSEEQVVEIAVNYDLDFQKQKIVKEDNLLNEIIAAKKIAKSNDTKRPPIITVMGHVDHGKTSLLDKIRKTSVVDREAGGITQSIGAYMIKHHNETITFFDTPGHVAFTQMRSRGALVTDIVVIVVAVDDGMMPQTKEAIEHAKAANVPIIVAINKMDLEGANPEKIKQDLTSLDLTPEEWGGSTPYINISAKTGMGIDKLLDVILLVAELGQYKCDPSLVAMGTVVETHVEKGKGNVITLLVENGTLLSGDSLILDTYVSKVRLMTNDQNKPIKKAGPSTPVKIIGFSNAPELGTKFVCIHDAKEAKKIAKIREQAKRDAKTNINRQKKLEEFLSKKENNQKYLSLIVKADSKGSTEAIVNMLKKLETDKTKLQIIRSDMGAITEADLYLAEANHALLYTFALKTPNPIMDKIKQKKLKLLEFDVIYHLLDSVEKHMKGISEKEYKDVKIGMAEIRKIFTFSKVGTIAGSYMKEGKVVNNAFVKLYRNENLVFEGKINSLKHEKNQVKEVLLGKEFGFTIEAYNDIKEGDQAHFYIQEEIVD